MRVINLLIYLVALTIQIKTFGQQNIKKDSLINFIEDSSKYFITPININSQNSEFSPILSNGKLIFASDRINTLGVVYTNENNSPFLDLFICNKIDSISFGAVKSLSKTINTAFNDGPACLSKNEKNLFFSSNSSYKFTLSQESTVQKNLQLYCSSNENGSWSLPTKLIFCDPNYSYTHPCLSPDEKTLFFSSNLKDGFGGMDIFYSSLENGVWSEPKNLGSKVNSSKNELFPYMSMDSLIYFSSDAPNGFGGLDIYSLDLKHSENSQKQLLELPINSVFDDFGIILDSIGIQGYFSSNRIESNKDDIYFFRNKYQNLSDCKPFVPPSYCFTFFEESTENNLQDAETTKLIYEWDLGDGTKIKGNEAKHCFKKPGNYNVELNIIEEASGALFYNEATYEFVVEDSEQVYINCPDTTNINSTINISADKSKIPGCTILSYDWNFGDGNYSSGISGFRKYKKEGKYNIQLGVNFKKDSTGKLNHYCIEKELYVLNETWKKHEKTIYMEPTNKKTTFSTANQDSLNFRVFLGSSETQVDTNSSAFNGLTNIKEFIKDSLFMYTSGNELKITKLSNEYNNAKRNGFTGASAVAYSSDSLIENQSKSISAQIPDSIVKLAPITNQESDRFNVVFFGFNEFLINKEYYANLDSISEILKTHKDYTVSIFAFADTIGNDAYNLKLSKKRAKEVKKYIINKGIKNKRIIEIPVGENSERDNKNLYLSPENKRRVSIKLNKKKQ